ncbi:cancer-associated gene 1 protein isoform X3 [Rhineura floridana]|uniref:cancer-associated gene 1 protein isoform X3 n=1 Tax=Rhineura floridana TaxID=261503 RepID=UPI002AC811C8|nr:cancer-associated gene 1 protein isoform X3 [Rhineura floridana]
MQRLLLKGRLSPPPYNGLAVVAEILCDVTAVLVPCGFTNETIEQPLQRRSGHQRRISTSEEDLCTREPLIIMNEVADPLAICHISPELIYKDLESCSTASEISQNEVQDSVRKSELDCTLSKEKHHFEPLFEDFIYGFEDASEKLMSPLNILRTCSINKESYFITERKESNDELLSQGESEQQCRVLDWPSERYRMEKDSSQKHSQEVMTENYILVEEFLVDLSDVPIMGESLLDCIVKESPIVSSFLTQPTGSLLKANVHVANEDLLVKWNGSNVNEETSSHEGNMMDMGQHTEPTKDFQDSELTVSPDALDENLDYIRTLMQSNRHLKECLRSNIAHCISKEKVADSTSLPEGIEVSQGQHNAESSSLYSEKSFLMEEERRQGDRGDKGLLQPHTNKSCCLSPYEASHKLCKRNTPVFIPKQLLLQEGDMDFSKVIKDLEQDQQKQLSHIVELQHGNIFFEKKIKEIEKVLLEEGNMDLNKTIQVLEQDQKKQQTQIMDLYYDNVSLETRIKELEENFLKKHDFIDTIRKLKENIADLTEAKNKVKEENEAERCPKSMEDALAHPDDHQQDFESDKKDLMWQLEKLNADYRVLQEKHQAETEEKVRYRIKCAELDCTLHKKEQEIQELNCIIQKLEHEASGMRSALHKLKEEREDTEKHSLSLQAELQRQKDERLAEREELSCKYNKLVAQIKLLQEEFENEQAEMEKMQQQVCAFRTEKTGLQQQMAKDKQQTRFLQLESARWKEQHDQIGEPQTLKDMKSMHSDLSIRSLHGEEDHFNSPYVQKASHLLSKIRSLLALAEGLLTCQDTDNQAIAECSTKSETVIELKGKMKSLSLKKKSLEKELQKHKEHIAAMRKLIINEKLSEDHDTMATEAGEEESDSGADLPDLLRSKLGEHNKQSDELHGAIKALEGNLASKEEVCKKLTGVNGKLQKDLGNLTCKVTSYEEIIERADQRLELANSEISYLEKRNQDLEDIIKKFKMNTRKLRKGWSSFFPKMWIQGDFQKLRGNHLITKGQTIKYAQYDCHCHSRKVGLQMTY